MQPGEVSRVVALQSTLARVVEGLLARTKASRVTLRQDLPGDYAFPVTHEALAPGAVSLREERTVDLRMQPVVAELARGRQVVQDDCRAAFDDPAFQRMLDTYGGLASQIVTPVLRDGRLAAILSLHQLGSRRRWSAEEIEEATRAAQEIGDALVDGSQETP
jgi:GAF domain-containing protein